jgi:hypothetical protein
MHDVPNNPTHDPVTGRAIHPQDDYDYGRDVHRNDPRRHLPNDLDSVEARQEAASAAGQPYFPTPWECWNIGKWWNVPEDEQAELIAGETAEHPWQEIVEPRLVERGLYRGRQDETPTPWDGSLADGANWGNIVTNVRIGVLWLRLNPDSLGRGTTNTKAISAIMRKLGWELKRTRVPGMRTSPKVWTHPESIGNGISEIADDVRNDIRTDDDDIPF